MPPQLSAGKHVPTPRQRWSRNKRARLSISFGIAGAFCIAFPSSRSWVQQAPHSALARWNAAFRPAQAYQPTAAATNHVVVGTRYSVMHNLPAGLTVILDVPVDQANKLRDSTYSFSSSSLFHLSDGGYDESRQLADSYCISLSRSRVAAVLANTGITSKDTLKTVLNGFQISQIGPDQDEGVFLVYGEDQHLIKRLQEFGVIQGRLQTNQSPSSATVTIPIDKHRKMDVVCGRRS